jgi:ABC-type sugar transport system ATPase subunit
VSLNLDLHSSFGTVPRRERRCGSALSTQVTQGPSDSGITDDPLLRVDGVEKAFGATQAIAQATFDLRAGEVHAIVGENGSGKSTLVKILAGIHRPDAGTLMLGDGEHPGLPSPRAALRAGIATVFQEVLVVEARSMLENVWLGHEGFLRSGLTAAVKRERASTELAGLLGRPPDLDAPVGMLSLSDRQTCCLARALVRDPRVLLLDEATSALDVATRERLFATLRDRVTSGAGVVFISHRMDEVAELADRITVMRSGQTVATLSRGEADTDQLVHLMTGEDRLTVGSRPAPQDRRVGEVVLCAEDLRLTPSRPPIQATIRAGELVGIAGLEGHGQDAFLRALAGGPRAGGGTIRCGDRLIGSSQDAADAGIAYVPRERRAESLFESKSILENFAMATLGRDAHRGLLAPRRTRARFTKYAERLGIVLDDPRDLITSLSGGNQQKVVMARWLATEPRVLLLNDPTRGIDLRTKRDVYALLRELASAGMAVVMLSTEVDEHVELMDRVLVFREHGLAAELTRDQLDRARLVTAFFGEAVSV